MQKNLCQLDALIPFAPILRRVRHVGISGLYSDIFTAALPLTLFYFALSAQIPQAGILVYALTFIPLAAWHHNIVNGNKRLADKLRILLWYFSVILIGAGSIWLAISLALAHHMVPASIHLMLGIIGLITIARPRFVPASILAYSAYHIADVSTPIDALLPVVLLGILALRLLDKKRSTSVNQPQQ